MKGKKLVQNLYFIIAGGGITAFIISILFDNVNAAKWLVMEHDFEWQFSDFFRQIIYASDLENIYFNTGDAPFPPFAYFWFHLLYKMNPVDAPIELRSWKIVQNFQYNLLFIVMFFILSTIFLVEGIRKIIRLEEKSFILFVILVVFSAPFCAGAIERGNIAIVACTLVLWAMYLKDSDVFWKRELSLIFIAMAAGLKIYPAIFGLIYVKERRWKEVTRLFLYGIAFFFFPFMLTGGFDGLFQYINVLGKFQGTAAYRWTNIRCYWFAILNKLGYEQNLQFGMILENIFLLICVLSMFKTKQNWKRILYLAGIMTVYVSNSHRYTAVYMLIPLVFWISQQEGKWSDYIYSVLFALIYTIPTYAYFIGGDVNFCIFTPIYLVLIFSMIDTWFWEKNRVKNKKMT